MAGIIDGQPVNQTASNAAWIAKNGDDATTGILGLQKTDGVSGGFITNSQRELNAIASQLGVITGAAYNAKITFTNSNGLTATTDLKTRAEELSARFHATTGHLHSGAAGDSPNIPSTNIASVVLSGVAVAGSTIASVAGVTSSNVSSLLVGKSASSGPTVKGIVVTAPYNKIILRSSIGTEIIDPVGGQVVYGRLTFAAGVWTLSYYTNEAGVETPYTLTITNMAWWYQQLFNPITDAPVYSELFITPSDNSTQDILDASTTQRGLVNTGTQSFAGNKTFTGTISASNLSGTNTGDVTLGAVGAVPNANGASLTGQVLTLQPADGTNPGVITAGTQTIGGAKTLTGAFTLDSTFTMTNENDATSGSLVTLATPTKPVKRLTSGTLVSIQSVTAPTGNQFCVLDNVTGVDVLIKHLTGNIHTGGTADLTFKNGTSIWLWYDLTSALWRIIGGSGSGFANPMTTLGDMLYTDATPAPARLAGNTTANKMFLNQTGTGAVSAAPVWSQLAASDIASGTLSEARGGTNQSTYAQGDMLYASAANVLSKRTIGTENQILTVQSGLPVWKENNWDLQLIPNPNGDNGTTGWTNYANAVAGPIPETGTGGTPTQTTIASATGTQFGRTNVLRMSKGALNAQGEGVSAAFTLPSALQSQVCAITADYNVNSGTFVAGSSTTDSDVTVWVYDITNAVLIHCQNYRLLTSSTTLGGKIYAEFQASANSTSYRLIFHVATTNASAWALNFGNVNIGRQHSAGIGLYESDLISWTPTFSAGFGTVTSIEGKYQIIGGRMIGYVAGTTGTVAASALTFSLPGSYSVSSKFSSNLYNVGVGYPNKTTNVLIPILGKAGDTTLGFGEYYGATATYNPLAIATGTGIFSNGDSFRVNFDIPLEQGATSQVISSYDGRQLRASYYVSTNYAVTAGQSINFDTRIEDTHSAVVVGAANTWRFTAPFSSSYTVSVSGTTTTGTPNFVVYKGATSTSKLFGVPSAGVVASGSYPITLLAGETIYVSIDSSLTVTGSAAPYTSVVSIVSGSGQQSIMAGQKIEASYWASANFTASSTTPINFDSKEFDSTNSVVPSATVWKFTSPTAGTYDVKVFITPTGVGTASYFSIYKNGTPYKMCGYNGTGVAAFVLDTLIQLNTGDYIDIRPNNSYQVYGGALTTAPTQITIKQVN